MSELIDIWLTRLRWPIAILAALLLPGVGWALVRLSGRVLQDPGPLIYFLLGCLAWIVLWAVLLRGTRFSLILTLEHELTHALFAWLTLHRVTGLRATLTRGGQMSFVGQGNFLITLAPYFFPTPTLLLLAALVLVPLGFRSVADLLIGATFGWHLTSTWRETHGGQSDIQRSGRIFSLLFLPPAILFFVGVVISFAHGGVAGCATFAASCVWSTVELVRLPFG